LNIRVNPEVLEWARREAGYTVDEIAKLLDVEPQTYTNWEITGTDIPLGKLKNISKQYKRQLAVFFLPKSPPDTQKPSDYRNFRLLSSGLSKKTLLAIRRARKYLDISAGVMGHDYWTNKYAWMNEVHTEAQLRSWLGISISDQQSFKSINEAFKAWRNNLESNLGILVFQFRLPADEVQAFCFSDTPPFGIVLNSAHHYSKRIFSLFHEIAHLMKAQSGICYHDELDANQSQEFTCNEFAGKFLVPDNIVPLATTLEELTYHANKLKVSREVILRRNLESDFISKNKFFELLAEIKKLPVPMKGGRSTSVIEKAQASRGQLFFNLIVHGVQANKLDFNTASDALGLKINYLMYA
jgi:Zn-dependent peptidase ImmA (M78 family)/transcriptional regulator with XRE-family HTH domain